MSEHTEQCALMQWAALQDIAELDLLHAIPNGGWRHAATAGRLRAEGVKPGVPDLCLPVPRGGYHGLYIELKVGRNKPTAHQQAWIKALRDRGYRVEVCWGWEAARDVIEEYLRVKRPLTFYRAARGCLKLDRPAEELIRDVREAS